MQTMFKDGSVMVCGMLPKDAEYKQVGTDSVDLTTFGVKVGEKPSPHADQKSEAIWCNCTCWRKTALAAKGLKKGDVVLCVGKIKTENYKDNEGNDRIAKKLVCEFVQPMQFPLPNQQAPSAAEQIGDLSEFEEVLNDGDMSF